MIHCLLLVLISIGFYGCGNKLSDGTSSELSGIVKLDGSSTVFPISEAVAEEFQKGNRGIRVTVGVSGTGGGMKKFGKNEKGGMVFSSQAYFLTFIYIKE